MRFCVCFVGVWFGCFGFGWVVVIVWVMVCCIIVLLIYIS